MTELALGSLSGQFTIDRMNSIGCLFYDLPQSGSRKRGPRDCRAASPSLKGIPLTYFNRATIDPAVSSYYPTSSQLIPWVFQNTEKQQQILSVGGLKKFEAAMLAKRNLTASQFDLYLIPTSNRP